MWLAEPFTRGQAWLDLIGLANYQAGQIRRRGIPVTVHRGQVGWSQEALAVRWKWSVGKVKRFLKEMKIDGRISIETVLKNVKVTSLITMTNYARYQGSGPEDGPEDGPGIRSEEGNKKKHTNPPRPKRGVSDRERIAFFETLWDVYPKKDESTKAQALAYYRSSVKTKSDMDLIDFALGDYLEYLKVNKTEPQYIKGGAAFFYDWADWIPKEVADGDQQTG